LNNYVFISIGRAGSTTELVTQKFVFVEEDDKRDELVKQLDLVEGRTLIFVATRKSADLLNDFFYQNGFSAASIHGERSQYEREKALESFKTGRSRILVATDVAARGLHIDNVSHVINFDLPSNIEDYVHRIGRTGRCGKEGLATGFFNHNNNNISRDLLRILRESNQEIPGFLNEYNRDKKKGMKNGFSNNYRGRGSSNYSNFGRRNNSFGGRSFSNGYSGDNDNDDGKFKSSYFESNQNDYQYDS